MNDYLETDFTWGGKALHSVEAESQWQVTVAGLMEADSVGVCFNLCLSNSGTLVFSNTKGGRWLDEAVACSSILILRLKRMSLRHFFLFAVF